MDFKNKLAGSEYSFLKDRPELNSNIILLVVGGSHSYGLETESSDLDIRGIAMDTIYNLYGLTNFEQFTNKETDTVIFSLSKALKLLFKGTSTLIELLGTDESHIIYASPEGKLLLENKELFISKRTARALHCLAKGKKDEIDALGGVAAISTNPKISKLFAYMMQWHTMSYEVLQSGKIITFRPDREYLMEIKTGKLAQNETKFAELLAKLEWLENNFKDAVDKSTIQDEANHAGITALIKEMTKGRYI